MQLSGKHACNDASIRDSCRSSTDAKGYAQLFRSRNQDHAHATSIDLSPMTTSPTLRAQPLRNGSFFVTGSHGVAAAELAARAKLCGRRMNVASASSIATAHEMAPCRSSIPELEPLLVMPPQMMPGQARRGTSEGIADWKSACTRLFAVHPLVQDGLALSAAVNGAFETDGKRYRARRDLKSSSARNRHPSISPRSIRIANSIGTCRRAARRRIVERSIATNAGSAKLRFARAA